MFRKTPIALAIAALTVPFISVADEERHPEKAYERIVITASPLDRTALESAQPVYVLSGDELRQNEAATLGETLRNLPGVQSTYFGPVSSSPVIRGLEGPRVKIVQNGLDVADISRGGPDHAVSTESTTARQIEVLRGPSTLLFGSGASGGVVNVVDNRVPRQPVSELTGHYSLGYSSVADMRNASVSLDSGNNDVAWHLDGFWREAGDYDVPEFQDHDGHTSDHIENSFTEDRGATVGASYFFDRGFAGVSYGRMERKYGLPGHSHGEDDHQDEHGHQDEEDIFADVTQDRFQFLSGFENPFAGIESLEVNLGYTELSHDEIEDGFIETGFTLEQTELRIIAHHNPIAGWRGAFGIQASQQEYDSFGVEAYTPHTDTELMGVFWMLEQRFNDITWEFGARIERVELDSEGLDKISYTPVSASFGTSYHLSPGIKFSSHMSYSERAPQTNELFANGAHFATRTYEVGGVYQVHEEHDEHGPDEHGQDDHGHDDHGHEASHHLALRNTALDKEKSTNLDLGFHYDGDKFHFDANIFFNRIDNFIFQNNTGILAGSLDADLGLHDDHGHDQDGHNDGHDHDHSFEGLPVYVYQQQDADLYGYEMTAVYEMADQLNVHLFSDYTRASFRDGGNVPRIPAQRVGLSAKYTEQNWDATVGYTQYLAQNKISDNEERTSGFGLVNAYFNYYPGYFANQDFAIYLKAENLTNELGFAHNSFIKEYAPMPGRNLGIGFRARF